MRAYSIPESMEAAYKGSGWAVAATLNGVVVGIVSNWTFTEL